MFNKLKSALMIAMAILTIMGIVTFSLFILEESLQTVMFGTWAAQDAGNWSLVLKGIDTNRKINETLKFMTKWFGWIQPFAWIAYASYGKSMDYYLDSLENKIMTKDPMLMDGRAIRIDFRPKAARKNEDGTVTYSMGVLHYTSWPDSQWILGFGELAGTLQMIDRKLYLIPNATKGQGQE